MVQVPRAGDVFDAEGGVVGGDEAREEWSSYTGRTWSQLEWWATAARDRKRAGDDPFTRQDAKAFVATPAQRDSPN